MRELLRSKVRAAMVRKGYIRLNKPTYTRQGAAPASSPSGGGSLSEEGKEMERNIQDKILGELQKERNPVTVFTINGYQMRGRAPPTMGTPSFCRMRISR